jgi:alpha-beta hydrolase superfamily lysophospholipase
MSSVTACGSYEVYGGEPTILFLPTWTFVHSRIWRMQIRTSHASPRRRVRPRGNGRSDRPRNRADYAESEFAGRVRCPVLVIHGTDDRTTSLADAAALANATSGRLVQVDRGDHAIEVRRPVEVNLAIREFVDPSFRRDPTVHRPDRGRAL